MVRGVRGVHYQIRHIGSAIFAGMLARFGLEKLSGVVEGGSERRTIVKVFRIESHSRNEGAKSMRGRIARVAMVAGKLPRLTTKNKSLT